MNTGNIPEKTTDKEQISIAMSTPIFQDMSPTNLVKNQEQEQVQVQR